MVTPPPFLPELRRTFADANGRPLAQAATVSPDGAPEVRTIVMRGLNDDGETWFASDARSEKIASLRHTPRLELCLFDRAAGVQWRLAGPATLHRGDALAVQGWRELPEDTRALFSSPPPGTPLAAAERTAVPPGSPRALEGAVPPESFAVVRLVPERCDRLELGPPLRRRRWQRQPRGWQTLDVVP